MAQARHRIARLVFLFAFVAALPPELANAQTDFICTEIIGYSTTSTWFPWAEDQVDASTWQLRWTNGGATRLWADPTYDGWRTTPVSLCAQSSRAPDRVVLDVAHDDYTTDISALEADIRAAVETLRRRYPSVRQIMLQPEHGGPDNGTCPWSDAPSGVIRATYNHPSIEAAIVRVVGGNVVMGPEPLVRSCDDFADSIGHLTADGARDLGTSNGQFYATRSPAGAPPPEPPTSTVRSANTSAQGSLRLNGNDAFARAPDAAEVRSTHDWTVEVWFRDDNPDGFDHDRARSVTKGDTGADLEVPFFLDVASNRLWAGRRIAGNSQVISVDLSGLDAGAWHHAAAAFDSARFQLSLYLDGIPVAQEPVAGVTEGNTWPITIGANGGGDYAWDGELDELRVWNIVRTPAEITANLANELAGEQPGLVGYWRFDEGAGAIASDGAGTPQDAALLGGAAWSEESPVGPPAP
jgi:hypothetical protein